MKNALLRKVLPIILVVLAANSCSNQLLRKPASGGLASLTVKVTSATLSKIVARQSGSRDILPDPLSPSDLTYRVELNNGSAPIVRDGLTAGGIVIDGLAVGTWSLTVTGYQTLGQDLFSATTSVDLAAGPNPISLTLDSLVTSGTGHGDLAVTLSWTAGQIDSASAYWVTDNTNLRATPLASGVSAVDISSSGLTISETAIASGTYYLTIDLKKNGVLAATVIECVRIFDNRQSVATFALDGQISQPPAAPTSLTIQSRPIGEIVFIWNDKSNIETGYGFSSDGGSTWTSLPADSTSYTVTSLPSVDTTYEVRASNYFGSSAAISYFFQPRRLFYDANGGTGAPSDTWVYDANGGPLNATASVLLPGGMARPGYIFSAWNTQADGLGTSYNPGDTLLLSATDITLYAQWANTGSISITLNDPATASSLDTLSLGSGAMTLDRGSNETITATATGATYDTYHWTIAGQGTAPALGADGSSSISIGARAGSTELALFKVTLYYGNGGYQYSKSFNLQVVDYTFVTFNFDSLIFGDLNGQDSWVTTQWPTAGTGDMQVSAGTGSDNSQVLSYDLTGSGYGVDASRPLSLGSPIDLSDPTVAYRLIFDMTKNSLGTYVGFGADLNADGKVSRTDYTEHALIFFDSTVLNAAHLYLPSDVLGLNDTTPPISLESTPVGSWLRIEMTLQAGSVTVRAMPLATGIWTTLWSVVNMGINASAADKTNPYFWNMLFIHFEGAGGMVDNVTLERYVP